eukprot:CAMPEP_0185735940 /NCGR_PEP_ID=MMETSP1171-20130828/26510_1 /TAXON_ID=374046 /ORGANISM="Helicotheca tamensis, Strain CCMP826" /LENGTH=160 /DNA_ID=CAMNT_0028406395 /DNA_START=15 /DNA_END=494 /DNA_ORIENTATION=-
MTMSTQPSSLLRLCTIILVLLPNSTYAYSTAWSKKVASTDSSITRKSFLSTASASASAALFTTSFHPVSANAAFAPGGTLVTDRDIGIQVGNPEASPSRSQNNENVLFSQDHYFKFGAAAPWILDGNTEFPKTMPFTLSQQRYDTLKKYGNRVVDGAKTI